MDIESILLSKNRDALDRALTFMRSIIVKNEVEADAAETTDTLDAYNKYLYAYEGVDTILDYNIYRQDLIDFGFTESDADTYSIYPAKLQTLVMYKDEQAKAFLKKLRLNRINSYVEPNTYYRPFCGLPASSDEYIYVKNTDKASSSDPDVILLHEVKYTTYPKTYNRLYYERDIDIVYSTYSYTYLQFLENPISPYVIRNKKQFDICYYKKNVLNANELPYFLESYDIARNEIISMDYIEAFQGTYSAYVNVMLLFILSYSFNLYCTKTLERYAVRDYTDDEIYDILDSNGLGNLKSLSMTLLKNIVKRLPDIKANIGTQNIIDVIFDIVADKTLTVKRYYIKKKYNIDSSGNTVIKDGQLYDKSVDLVFAEKTIKKGSEAVFSTDSEYDYDTIAIGDDTWGGTQFLDTSAAKLAVKDAMKKEILSKDFSTIMTKYLGLSKIIDMYAKMTELNDKLGLLYQANEYSGNFMKDDTVTFNGQEVTALSLYAAWCLVYGTLSGMTDPDYIVSNASTLEGIMKLRKIEKLGSDADIISNESIDLGNGFKRTIGDYLTKEELQKYMVTFKYTVDTTIETLMSQYASNYAIIEAIKTKIEKAADYDEFQVWNLIYQANIASTSINSLFGGNKTYSYYIKTRDTDFYKYIDSFFSGSSTSKANLYTLCSSLKTAFATYITKKSNSTVTLATTEDDVVGGESLTDIAALFNEFTSCYTQLYKQDFHVGYDDPTENSIVLLYAKCVETIITHDNDSVELVQALMKDVLKDSGTIATLELLDYIQDMLKSSSYDELVLGYELTHELVKSVFVDRLILDYDSVFDVLKTHSDESVELVDTIISNKEIINE